MSLFTYMVDVNLPKYFSFFNQSNFIHVADINPRMTDREIQDYAFAHNMVILTKDSDFLNYIVLFPQGPKIVYLQLGNQTLRNLHAYFELYWNKIMASLPDAKLIIAHPDNIRVILQFIIHFCFPFLRLNPKFTSE